MGVFHVYRSMGIRRDRCEVRRGKIVLAGAGTHVVSKHCLSKLGSDLQPDPLVRTGHSSFRAVATFAVRNILLALWRSFAP